MSSGNATRGILRLPNSTLVRPLTGHTRSSLGIYRDSPCRSLVPGARPTRRRPIASSVCPPSKLTRRRLGALSHQRHGRPLPRSSSSGNTLLHPPVARAPVLARATPRLSRRCRSFSSSFSSRARSYVEHGRKGLWFHRRCRGKWSCQKGLLRRHLY